jgi:aspartyl-tRNA(Asn)/glutamyl-tRNA(Gln) amidotransferase subunit B
VTFGTRVEIKNINSFRFVQKAIEWEIAHQIATVSAGGRVEQVTKTWDDAAGRCHVLRRKEGSDDYRYFPDPDLPPLVLTDAYIHSVREALPELPAARRERYMAHTGVSAADAQVITEHPVLADFYEQLVAQTGDAKRAANWVCNAVKSGFESEGLRARLPVSVTQLATLFVRIDDKTLSSKLARDVYNLMVGTQQTADEIIDRMGWRVVTDEAAIEKVVRTVLDAAPRQVAAWRAGKKNIVGYFKGEVMKVMGGKADPKALDAILLRLLET